MCDRYSPPLPSPYPPTHPTGPSSGTMAATKPLVAADFEGMSYSKQYDLLFEHPPLNSRLRLPKPPLELQAQEPGASRIPGSFVWAVQVRPWPGESPAGPACGACRAHDPSKVWPGSSQPGPRVLWGSCKQPCNKPRCCLPARTSLAVVPAEWQPGWERSPALPTYPAPWATQADRSLPPHLSALLSEGALSPLPLPA